jgi:hypothetical protein
LSWEAKIFWSIVKQMTSPWRLEQTDLLIIGSKETASFGWLLIENKNVLIRGVGPVDGIPLVLSSTWAELFGIVAPNLLLFHFMKFHQIESKSKCMKCVDNWVAISRVNQSQHKISRRWQYSNDIDIVTVIISSLASVGSSRIFGCEKNFKSVKQMTLAVKSAESSLS